MDRYVPFAAFVAACLFLAILVRSILDKIPEPPQWWDEYREPRYVEFASHRVADIYADEAALAEIACFGCLTIYKLACSSLDFERYERAGLPLAAAIRRGDLQVCDPPNPGCCRDGPPPAATT